MIAGFKNFIMKGNVVDLAVGVIIGAAFGGVVDGLVKGIIEPALGAVVGSPEFKLMVGPLNVGMLLTAIVNFVLKAAAIYFFVVIPFQNMASKTAPAAAGPTPTEATLTEIRDLMKIQVDGRARGAGA
jgi:large conductance mechanosensitive channel